MAGTFLGYPFDAEVFSYLWRNEPDKTLTILLNSGVLTRDTEIKNLISNGSNTYDLPFNKKLTGTELNYDGQTDITGGETSADIQTGVVYGRVSEWIARDFIRNFNSGADPMKHIASSVGKFTAEHRQARLIKILNAIFGINGKADWTKHTYEEQTKTATVDDVKNKIKATSANNAMTQALGDASKEFSFAVMHSSVATTLQNMQLLEFIKYTDAQGLQRNTNLANWGQLTVLVDDGVPVKASASASGNFEYTTYLLGNGAFAYEDAPLKGDEEAVELTRDSHKNGGQNSLITRFRETIHPYGFSFDISKATNKISPIDTDLETSANWTLKYNAKNIPIARIITNG